MRRRSWKMGTFEMIKYKLGNLCNDVVDCPHSTPIWKNSGVRVIRNFNIKGGRLDFTDGYYVDEETYIARTKRAIPECGDLVISREAPMGAVCIIPKRLQCCLGQRLVLLKVNKKIADPKYLCYMIQGRFVQSQIERINLTGSIVSNLNIPDLKSLIIPLPSLPIQRKIAAVLTALDDKIALNKRINDKLEAMAKRLYDYWFVQFDFPDENGRPYKSSGGKMVWNETLKREIPEGWKHGTLSEIANITMGQSPDGNTYNDIGNGIIFYQGSTDFGMRFPTVRQYTTAPSRFAQKGDILMSVRAPVGAVNIANTDCCIGRGLAALNPKACSISYLYFIIDTFKHTFENKNTVGTTFGSITKDELHMLPVCIPSNIIASLFQTKTRSIFDKQLLIDKETVHLTALRDRLLPLLMNGQVVVDGDE